MQSETDLQQALCAKADLAKYRRSPRQAYLGAEGRCLKCEISLVLAPVVVGHVGQAHAESAVGIELDYRVAPIVIIAVEHEHVIVCVGVRVLVFGRREGVCHAQLERGGHLEIDTGCECAPCVVDLAAVVHVCGVHLCIAAIAQLEFGTLCVGAEGNAHHRAEDK